MSGVHHHHGHAHGEERASLTARAALASIVMAVLLIGLKAWAAFETSSMAMLGSLADSLQASWSWPEYGSPLCLRTAIIASGTAKLRHWPPSCR